MVTTALFVLATMPGFAPQPGPLGELWMETPSALEAPGYHPALRFSCWDITRFNRSSTYMLGTPRMVQQGQFTTQGNQYLFRAVMANEIEVADKDKLIQEMSPDQARVFSDDYAKSMENFVGVYNPSKRSLTISYRVEGSLRSFELYNYTAGTDKLPTLTNGAEKGLVGMWNGVDPYPGRLDARTRQKIQENGLQIFFREASSSDGSVLSALHLRQDKSYRRNKTIGRWGIVGGMLELVGPDGQKYRFAISADGKQLLAEGRPVFSR